MRLEGLYANSYSGFQSITRGVHSSIQATTSLSGTKAARCFLAIIVLGAAAYYANSLTGRVKQDHRQNVEKQENSLTLEYITGLLSAQGLGTDRSSALEIAVKLHPEVTKKGFFKDDFFGGMPRYKRYAPELMYNLFLALITYGKYGDLDREIDWDMLKDKLKELEHQPRKVKDIFQNALNDGVIVSIIRVITTTRQRLDEPRPDEPGAEATKGAVKRYKEQDDNLMKILAEIEEFLSVHLKIQRA